MHALCLHFLSIFMQFGFPQNSALNFFNVIFNFKVDSILLLHKSSILEGHIFYIPKTNYDLVKKRADNESFNGRLLGNKIFFPSKQSKKCCKLMLAFDNILKNDFCSIMTIQYIVETRLIHNELKMEKLRNNKFEYRQLHNFFKD